jgi:hypothetical protein
MRRFLVFLGSFLCLWSNCGRSPVAPTATNPILFQDSFSQYGNGLITNEFAFWNPTNPSAKRSEKWEMTSGSLFALNGEGWTGVPDSIGPNVLSTNGTNSAIFRLTTKDVFIGNVEVSLEILNDGLIETPKTPRMDLDGVHLFLRYQSEESLYYASVNRRDNRVVIKKKVPGGPSNNGTYVDLSDYVSYVVPFGTWQKASATIVTNSGGSVSIELSINGVKLLSAIDRGAGGYPPITIPGKFGIRGDNANLRFRNFVLTVL